MNFYKGILAPFLISWGVLFILSFLSTYLGDPDLKASTFFFTISYGFLGLIYFQIIKVSLHVPPVQAFAMTMGAMWVKFFLRVLFAILYLHKHKEISTLAAMPSIVWFIAFLTVEVWLTMLLGKVKVN